MASSRGSWLSLRNALFWNIYMQIQKILIIIALLGGGIGFLDPTDLSAAPVNGEVRAIMQPDGTRVSVRIWGDEFYQVVESLDGYTLIRDPSTRVICYATLSSSGDEYVSTKVPLGSPLKHQLRKHLRISREAVHEKVRALRDRYDVEIERYDEVLRRERQTESIQKQQNERKKDSQNESMNLTTGSVRGLCLLIDFPDERGIFTPSEVERFCNQIGYREYGNNGSIHDYFYDVSDGMLVYTNDVTSTYYTAKYQKTYYDRCDGTFGAGAKELILEALRHLEESGFDFKRYDSNGDGIIDALNAFYAGTTRQGWGCGLWPHTSVVDFRADGVRTRKYQIAEMGQRLSIGTFCHENGHLLCDWPDLYDYDFDSGGVGLFCLMGLGNFPNNPCEPCAFVKIKAGWERMELLSLPRACLLKSGENRCYKLPNPNQPGEYFLLENRLRFGRDARIPDSGLAIWHIDETYGDQRNQQRISDKHYLVTLVQADGYWNIERNQNMGDASDLWGYPDYPSWGPSTVPSSGWWNGKPSGMTIDAIGPAREELTFSFLGEAFPESLNINTETNFPDPNFRRIVESWMGTIANGFFTAEQAADRSARMGVLRCDRNNIQSLKGIEYFPLLTSLDCSDNLITELRLANNTALTSLRCSRNRIQELDVSGMSALRTFECGGNPLRVLDLSDCPLLRSFHYPNGMLSQLDLSFCSGLAEVDCRGNQIEILSVTGCVALQWFWCAGNQLHELDIKDCAALSLLDCSSNQIASIATAATVPLRTLSIRNNQLESIQNLVELTSLRGLDVRNNRLMCDDWNDVLTFRQRLGSPVFQNGDEVAYGFAYSPQQFSNPYDCTNTATSTPLPTPTTPPSPTPTRIPTAIRDWILVPE